MEENFGSAPFLTTANYTDDDMDDVDFSRQHFVIETQRSGQSVKMMKKEDLEIGLYTPSCSSLEMTSEYFPWFKTAVVILCFDIFVICFLCYIVLI